MGNYTQYFVITYKGKEYEKNLSHWAVHLEQNITNIVSVSSVQSLNHVQLFVIPWTVHHQHPVHYQLPECAQTHVHRVGDTIQPSLYIEYI